MGYKWILCLMTKAAGNCLPEILSPANEPLKAHLEKLENRLAFSHQAQDEKQTWELPIFISLHSESVVFICGENQLGEERQKDYETRTNILQFHSPPSQEISLLTLIKNFFRVTHLESLPSSPSQTAYSPCDGFCSAWCAKCCRAGRKVYGKTLLPVVPSTWVELNSNISMTRRKMRIFWHKTSSKITALTGCCCPSGHNFRAAREGAQSPAAIASCLLRISSTKYK